MIAGIIAASVAAVFWGFLWYHPLFVGSQWMKMAHPGKTSEQIGAEFSKIRMPLAAIGQAVTMTLLYSLLIVYLKIETVDIAVKFAFLVGGIVMSVELVHLPFTQTPVGLYLIDQLYNLTILLIGSVVITMMP